MDSLVASYGSDDDEEEHQVLTSSSKTSTILPSPSSSSFFSLPQPKSSSSLPPPKSHLSVTPTPQSRIDTNSYGGEKGEEIISDPSFQSRPNPKITNRFFSSLPEPKSNPSNSQIVTRITNSSSSMSSKPNNRVVIQLKPPVMNRTSMKSYGASDDDEDDEEEQKLRKRRRESDSSFNEEPSVKSFLSSMPAPKSSLGSLVPSSTSLGRRSIIIDEEIPTSIKEEKKESTVNYNNTTNITGNSEGGYVNDSSSFANYEALNDQSGPVMTGVDSSSWIQSNESYSNYDAYHESYATDEHYSNNLYDGAATATAISQMPVSFAKTHFKRGRNEIPTDMVEVNQDELMKNRPREDQVKLTGIAFGPSYQPASTKGKPTKLHKRKHQIGSLYFDMKQNEMQLSERRAKGFLTKAETQAKYGW